MRKALQAEQSKAEKLLQLASLEKRCSEKEAEVKELRKTIESKLKAEEEEKQRTEAEHERETQEKNKKNKEVQKKLHDFLMDLNKGGDGNWMRHLRMGNLGDSSMHNFVSHFNTNQSLKLFPDSQSN